MAQSEYKRSRVYYSKAQITNGLITNGGEWMYLDTTEYIGQYHKYVTGEVFSESNFVEGKSRRLIPYIDVASIGSVNDMGIDIATNYEYDRVKQVDIKKTFIPNQNVEEITDKDTKRAYFERYFGYKQNDGRVLELSQEDYAKIGTKDGLAAPIWVGFKLKWKIKGPVYDILDEMGNIKESGVFDTNKRTVELYSEQYPNLKSKLLDFLEYYTP